MTLITKKSKIDADTTKVDLIKVPITLEDNKLHVLWCFHARRVLDTFSLTYFFSLLLKQVYVIFNAINCLSCQQSMVSTNVKISTKPRRLSARVVPSSCSNHNLTITNFDQFSYIILSLKRSYKHQFLSFPAFYMLNLSRISQSYYHWKGLGMTSYT